MRLRDVESDFLGEFIGTCLLVFFGCGSVIVTVIYSAFSGLFQVAAIWGIGVTLDLCDEALVLPTSESSCQRRDGPGGKNVNRWPLFCWAISGRICSSSRSVFVVLIEHSKLREQ